jgi:hypothetical protein
MTAWIDRFHVRKISFRCRVEAGDRGYISHHHWELVAPGKERGGEIPAWELADAMRRHTQLPPLTIDLPLGDL